MKCVAGLCLVMLALVAPYADAFFWGCDSTDDHDNLLNSTLAEEILLGISPAKLYLRSARNGARQYSCIEMTLYGDPQAPPARRTLGAESRCDFWAWLFGTCPPPPSPQEYEYNMMITYYDSTIDGSDPNEQNPVEVRGNFSISGDEPYQLVLDADLPESMFGSDGSKTTQLTWIDLGEGYAIFAECVSSFLSFGTFSYAYMFVNDAIMDLAEVDVKCMADTLGDELGNSVHPAGMCVGGG